MSNTARISQWEGNLEPGARVIAHWSKTVYGTVHIYQAPAEVVQVNSLDIRVRPDHNGGDRKLGRTLSIPRAMNRKRNENNKVSPVITTIAIDDLGIEASDRLVRCAWLGLNEPQRHLALLAMNKKATTRGVHAIVKQLDDTMTALELCDALTLGRLHISKRDGQDLLDIIAPKGASCHDW